MIVHAETEALGWKGGGAEVRTILEGHVDKVSTHT